MVKFDSINLVVTSVLILNLFVGMGNYFTNEYDEAGFLNPTVSYGNISGVDVDNASFGEAAAQLESNPILRVVTSTTRNILTILYGIPVSLRDVMDLASIDVTLTNTIYASLIAILTICYILFLINMVSYLRGGGT